jgi:hypothetical protein
VAPRFAEPIRRQCSSGLDKERAERLRHPISPLYCG